MAWKKTNDIHYQNIADSIRYAKDGTEYTTTLERARSEIAQDNEYFEDIAEAIQSKTGQAELYSKDELASEITDELIKPNFETKEVTPSTVQQDIAVTPNTQYNGLEKVVVKPTPLESATITPTTQQQVVTPTAPNIGLSSVTVEATPPPPTLITKQITENGTYSAEDDNADGYREVEVNVPDESKAVLDSLIDRSITTITSDVTTIGSGAFQDCRALTEVNFPKATSIFGQAFYNCTTLSEVNFLKVSFIGSNAFYNCRALKYFDMSEVDNVPTIYANTFNGSAFIFLFRDQMQLDEYASATNWAALADRFQIKGATS